MKRKLLGGVLLLCPLVCVMGASSIGFDAKQPGANPGGKPQALAATGTYTVDPGETLFAIEYSAKNTKTGQVDTIAATTDNGKWNATLRLVVGNYDCSVALHTTNNATKNRVTTRSLVVNKNVSEPVSE